MKLNPKMVKILLGLAILLSIFMRLYQIDEAFFNFDQDRDAWQMKKMIVEKKPTLIGPDIRRGRFKFFLGPYHYYFFLPSLYLSKLDPIGPIIFGALIGVLTTLLVYVIGKDIFGVQTGLIASFIHAGSFYLSEAERMPWNPFHLYYLTLFYFFSLTKALKGRKYFLVMAAVILGLLLQVHPTTIFLFPMIVFVFYHLHRQKNDDLIKIVLLSCLAFILVVTPLLLFELRHEFLNSQLILSSFQERTTGNIPLTERLNGFWRVTAYIHQEIVNLFTKGRNYATDEEGQWLILILPIFWYFVRFIKRVRKKKTFINLLLLPWALYLLGFSIFLGNVSNTAAQGELQLYYFRPVAIGYLLLFSFGLSLAFGRSNHLSKTILAGLFIFILVSLNWRLNFTNSYSYLFKKKAVEYIVADAGDTPFSLHFDDKHAFGYLDGFRYLFSLYGQKDLGDYENPSYIISIPPNVRSVVQFGNIGIVAP